MKHILESAEDLKYGAIHIVVHDGRIVQIERTERIRFDSEENQHDAEKVKKRKSKAHTKE